MFRPALLTLLLAMPLHAQDAGPSDHLREGIDSCIQGTSTPTVIISTLTAKGWRQSDVKDETITLSPAADDTVFVVMDHDGYFCDIQSTTVGVATASDILAKMLTAANVPDITTTKTEDGCTHLNLPNGTYITVYAGGPDPNCTSATDSRVRFDYFSE